MVYKKYIKRDGKLYGPYMYESKRIDGKVVSEYHGPKKTVNLKKFAWIFASGILVLFLAYFLATFNFGGLTGFAVFNTQIDSISNEPIKGNVNIFLKEGELIPSSSKLILENDGQIYEYNLDEIVSNNIIEGNFHVDGTTLSGSGMGYGIEGSREIYPQVDFVLEIYSPSQDNVSDDTSIAQPVTENKSAEIVPDFNSVSVPEENASAETTEPTPTETSPITGFFVKIYGFFLGLTPTGNVVSDSSIELNGQASLNNPFVYGTPSLRKCVASNIIMLACALDNS